MTPSPRPLFLPEETLDRLGIGAVVLHGRVIVRANQACLSLLDVAPTPPLVGRIFASLLPQTEQQSWEEWLTAIKDDPVSTPAITLSLGNAADGSSRKLRASAAILEGWPVSTRLITLQEVVIHGSDVPAALTEMRRTLRGLLDGNPVPSFLLDADHVVIHWNKACEAISGAPASAMVGTRNPGRVFYKDQPDHPVLADLVIDGRDIEEARKIYGATVRLSPVIADGIEGESYFSSIGGQERWIWFTASPIRNAQSRIIGATQTMVDITSVKRAEVALRHQQSELESLVKARTAQLEATKQALEADITRREQVESELRQHYAEVTDLNTKLKDTQQQLVQSEKLASIGQLAAGVAHEINNPIGYVHSNLGSLEQYLSDLFSLLDAYVDAEAATPESIAQARALRQKMDLNFLREDIPSLLGECREGVTRVRKIVQDLKDFSRVDSSQEWQFSDLHQGLDSTLNIAFNEIKYRADVEKEYGELPQVECLPSQLNQVFMNLMVNAAHAMGEMRGKITLRTGICVDAQSVWVEIADNGSGIPAEIRDRIFDPFFTTKPIGKGTGLGLSLAYGIIKKHNGRIELDSEPGRGSTFRIILPVHHAASSPEEVKQ
ncbi:ATP-binding protein [Niveibacterium terrae]|uniref:ATP-binding protein n=1 Tax=Niveibacterium terrae TaxID=3373598 RepID=UPI003A902B50